MPTIFNKPMNLLKSVKAALITFAIVCLWFPLAYLYWRWLTWQAGNAEDLCQSAD
jgi:hypothetical protein